MLIVQVSLIGQLLYAPDPARITPAYDAWRTLGRMGE
jgi:hypothetical protein